ncbi:MAG: alpha/beta fold hydrolase [Proteobacteria bacterium]|nr:alpha/beta fold hydrolase [Pseudomonadota bacterium]
MLPGLSRSAAVLALALTLGGSVAAAEPLTQLPGLSRAMVAVPITSGGTTVTLEALLTQPSAPGRHPLMVLSHGAPRDAAERPHMRPTAASGVAIEFARRGWAVVAPMRRGYGRSDGAYVESSGPCRSPDYAAAARRAAEDLLGTIAVMARRDDIDASRILLVGNSAGGFSSLAAAAQQPHGVVAVLNFAGGRGSDGPDSVCRADALIETFGSFGRSVRVPTLWFYAENDHFFGPALARRFFAAFTQTGGTGAFIALPAWGSDGHYLLRDEAIGLWRDRVDQFLRQHGLPTWAAPIREPVPDLAPPPHIASSGRDQFARYLASLGFEKAFAVGATHGFGFATGQRNPQDAGRVALETCAKYTSDCHLYAVNNARAR